MAPIVPQAGAACATTTTLCIDNRFQIAAQYSTTQGAGLAGSGRPIALQGLAAAQGGLFWFFAAGTNVGFTVTVTDTQTGSVATYRNPDQTAAVPVQDTGALPCS